MSGARAAHVEGFLVDSPEGAASQSMSNLPTNVAPFSPSEREPLAGVLEATAQHALYAFAARIAPAGTVLDAGCGTGQGAQVLAQRSDLRVTAVDPSAPLVEAVDGRTGVVARQAELDRLPFGDDSFDAVVCADALSSMPDPAPVLDELVRVLRSGGLLVATICDDVDGPTAQLVSKQFKNVATAERVTLLGTAVMPENGLTNDRIDLPGGGSVLVASDEALPALSVSLSLAPPGVLEAWRVYDQRRNEALRQLAARTEGLEADRRRLDEAQRLVLAAEQKAAGARALEEETAELRRQIAELHHQIALINGSITWRATAPLRSAAARGKRVAQNRFQETALETLRRWRGS
jgi:SAM-dependent methyltransferase